MYLQFYAETYRFELNMCNYLQDEEDDEDFGPEDEDDDEDELGEEEEEAEGISIAPDEYTRALFVIFDQETET